MRELFTGFRWWENDETQSLLVEDGRVVARGAEVSSPGAPTRDLGGRTVAPAFVDAHCHILSTGLDLQRLHLGGCATREEVLERVRGRLDAVEAGEWLRAVHYDQTKFDDAQHLTRHDLDTLSESVPILLRHSNGHASIANTAALRAAGVGAATVDPPGGEYVRDASGEPNGVLLEKAHEWVTAAAPRPSLDQMADAIVAAGERMRDLGICCASDMQTGQRNLDEELQAYRLAAERGCPVRTRLYLDWHGVLGPKRLDPGRLNELVGAMDGDRCRVVGVKIFADGAIGSATAAIYGRFLTQPETGSPTAGQLIYRPERLKQMVLDADEAGWQVAIHSIGDHSTDLVMDAFESTGQPSRHRIEHAMLLSDAQIERLARLDLLCTMQPEFLLRFGHAYRKQLGEERAYRIKRFASVMRAGVRLSFSSDRPIVPGDPKDGVRMAVCRPAGFDPAENVDLATAIRAYTREGARANGDVDLGGLEPGMRAEFQLLDLAELSPVGPRA